VEGSTSVFVFQEETKRWRVEKFKNGNVALTNCEPSHSVYIGYCEDTDVVVTKKTNNITVDHCRGVNVTFIGTVSSFQMVNSKDSRITIKKASVTVQVRSLDYLIAHIAA
jgi:hypothetical protein